MSIPPNMYTQRNKHIRDIKNFLMSEIFHAYNNEKEIELEHILLKNHKALNLHGILPSFIYKKEFYTIRGAKQYIDSNKIIHPSMLEEIVSYFSQIDFNYVVRSNKINNYIINVLSFANSKQDLEQLIPGRFVEIIRRYVNSDIFDINEPMEQNEIFAFKERNKNDLVEFQKLFLETLLMV